MGLLAKRGFFKELGATLNKTERRELASYLGFKRVPSMTNVMNHGDKADNFYIILKGVATVLIPNIAIKDRAIKNRDY